MKKLLTILLCLAMTASLAACGGGSSTKEETAAAEGTAAVAEGGEVVFNYSVYFEETHWDPAYFMQADDASLAPMIYENLVELQEDGSVKPQLAESWEVSDDGLQYTFKLRQGVQWHKGYGEFTSEDVKFTLERQKDEALASVNAENLGIGNIDSIECPDPYTVVINLKQLDVDLCSRLGMYYGYIVCKAHNDKDGMESLNTDPIGTGAFVFDGGTLAVKTEAVANPDWWGDREGGNIDRIISNYITDSNTRYTAFDNGELDAIFCFDFDKLAAYKEAGFTEVTVPERELLYVGVNMQNEPFDNEKVREAFIHAIDPQYFIDNLFFGNETEVGSYIPPSCKYAITDYFKSSYDPELSKQLLAEAGYPDGCPITFWGCNDAMGEAPTVIAVDMMQKAGFVVEHQSVDFGVYIEKVRNGEAQAWLLYNSTGATADDTMARYKSSNYPGNNWCGCVDEEYDKLVDAGLNATTEEEKAENFAAAQKRMMDLNFLYPVTSYSTHVLYPANISGIKVYGDQAFRVTTIVKE